MFSTIHLHHVQSVSFERALVAPEGRPVRDLLEFKAKDAKGDKTVITMFVEHGWLRDILYGLCDQIVDAKDAEKRDEEMERGYSPEQDAAEQRAVDRWFDQKERA